MSSPEASPLMTSAEFKCSREFLGLTGDTLARLLQVNPRTIRAWEEGKYPIPPGVATTFDGLHADARSQVTAYIDTLADQEEPTLITYRNDAEFDAAPPAFGISAGWHRAIIARVAQHVPELTIVFPGENPPWITPGE